MRLSALYTKMTPEQREKLAKAADTDAGYLWQLATRWRGKRASIPLMVKLAAADKRLTVEEMVAEFSEEPDPEKARAA